MKRFFKIVTPVFVGALIVSNAFCTRNKSYANRQQTVAGQELAFAVNISDDSVKQQEYFNYHKYIWPEVVEGFKKAGFIELKMYRYGRTIFMTITIPEGTNIDELSRKATENNPRGQEWNKIMALYQEGIPGTPQGAKWVKLDEFVNLNILANDEK